MANVALPTIGKYFDTLQVQLNLIAVAYSLRLGALVDRYGRKQMAIPAALVSGFVLNGSCRPKNQ